MPNFIVDDSCVIGVALRNAVCTALCTLSKLRTTESHPGDVEPHEMPTSLSVSLSPIAMKYFCLPIDCPSARLPTSGLDSRQRARMLLSSAK